MVKKEKVFGWAKSKEGLERSDMTQGGQRGPPREAVLAVSKRSIIPDLRQDSGEHLEMWAIFKSLRGEITVSFCCPDH